MKKQALCKIRKIAGTLLLGCLLLLPVSLPLLDPAEGIAILGITLEDGNGKEGISPCGDLGEENDNKYINQP